MDVLNVEDDSFHVTREHYSHLSDSEWEVVGRMSVLMGEPAISGMLEILNGDQKHAAINTFQQGQLAVERQNIALRHKNGSHQSMGRPTHRCRPETLKIDISRTSKVLCLGLKFHDPDMFELLEILKSRLKETFEPPRAESRARSALLRLKQGKRDVHAYSQHLRYLASSVTSYPVDKHTLINVSIYGLVDGPVKTYMFREDFHTLE
uniref:Retrotransposon gag domain-containing protein n=1 Tax=Peronospora matthiolae TaxID=2874970 RepID=A0AAV1U3J9_9STRA